MAVIDLDDDFFGDQSSESDSNSYADRGSNKGIRDEMPSDPFGNVANHEYRSREASIKTLSYLDGYDETKEEKLQDGFSNGYRQSFKDAFRIGRRLGSLCAHAALNESLTLGLNRENDDTIAEKSDSDSTKNIIERPAKLVRQFLTDEIIIGSKEGAENRYDEALLKVEDQLEKVRI
mmetsp:Transcript_8944/g.20127  ORF Transcript_8944/g.20127 Transcript_8944/m.20127 type:complete len:177 (+) Transcript_8944:163-693(+)|eukprot:CAMPEP_0172331394 /NCGR_PEP_ID=MMETSP1058-20130122/61905_1 /TAXON_ID=83371 /ORGANISM="Detonula confervacea, Strain CCMP 353" /LENGTH=176 /DNA_ID=CAMNT_0013048659 /DNA_START=110 /DNA_END=640 /DNA_ORIENTATION=+